MFSSEEGVKILHCLSSQLSSGIFEIVSPGHWHGPVIDTFDFIFRNHHVSTRQQRKHGLVVVREFRTVNRGTHVRWFLEIHKILFVFEIGLQIVLEF